MLKIGWASREITPKRPAMIMGQKHRRIGRSALDPITVTALAMEGQTPEDASIIVSCDLCFPSEALTLAVRRRLADTIPGLPADRVILNATHTHTSLVIVDNFYAHPGGDVMTFQECEAWVADRAVEAAAEAWATRKPGAVGRAFGHAVVGHNRYAVYAGGGAQMYGQTNRPDFSHFGGYEDHSLDMLFAWDGNGALTGLALTIPCPSQVDEGLEQFSADYWHDIRAELRARFGGHIQVLALCGAAGDQSPHFLIYGPQEREMRQRHGITERGEIARRTADAVARALERAQPEPESGGGLAHRVQKMGLTPRSISRAERDWAQTAYEKSCAAGDKDSWFPTRLRHVINCFDGVERAEPFPVEIHVLRVGGMALATNPFELFLDFAMRIKARSPAPQTTVVQLAGPGIGWYLPTAQAVAAGGYGAMPAVSAVGPEGGAELVEATLSLIGELFPC